MRNLMKDKRGFYAKEWLIASIVFGGIVALAIVMIGGYAETNSNMNVIDDEFGESYNQFSETQGLSENIYQAASGEEGTKIVTASELLFSSTFTVIGFLWDSLNMPGIVLGHFSQDFGIPSSVMTIFASILLTILTVMIVFAIIGSVQRRDL